MDNKEIDALVISACSNSWQKCAMVIAKTVDLAEDKITPDECAASIKKLLKAGVVISQGEISQWRESEIRLS